MPRVGGALTGENPLPHDPPALGLEGLDGGRDARKLPLRDVVRLRARLRDAGETGVEAPDRPDFCEESTRDIRWSVLDQYNTPRSQRVRETRFLSSFAASGL